MLFSEVVFCTVLLNRCFQNFGKNLKKKDVIFARKRHATPMYLQLSKILKGYLQQKNLICISLKFLGTFWNYRVKVIDPFQRFKFYVQPFSWQFLSTFYKKWGWGGLIWLIILTDTAIVFFQKRYLMLHYCVAVFYRSSHKELKISTVNKKMSTWLHGNKSTLDQNGVPYI